MKLRALIAILAAGAITAPARTESTIDPSVLARAGLPTEQTAAAVLSAALAHRQARAFFRKHLMTAAPTR